MTLLARFVTWLFSWRRWRPPTAHVSQQWLGTHTYEGIREERVREAER